MWSSLLWHHALILYGYRSFPKLDASKFETELELGCGLVVCAGFKGTSQSKPFDGRWDIEPIKAHGDGGTGNMGNPWRPKHHISPSVRALCKNMTMNVRCSRKHRVNDGLIKGSTSVTISFVWSTHCFSYFAAFLEKVFDVERPFSRPPSS